MSAKWVKLREIVGEVEEEEPEGEAVVGPSGEATIHSSGITPSLLSFLLLLLIYAYTYAYFFSQHVLTVHFTPEFLAFFSWQMSLPMRRYIDLKLRKRRMWTPCAVGSKEGAPCSTRGGGTGASVGGEFISFFSFGFYRAFYFFLHSHPCTFFIF